MSTCNELGCLDCRRYIVVGTDFTPSKKPLWDGQERLDALGEFLEAHRGHTLVFANEHQMDQYDMQPED